VIYSTFDDMRGLRVFARIRFPRWKAALADRLAWGNSRLGGTDAPFSEHAGRREGSSGETPPDDRARGVLPVR
jgi:hypothetical protein